MTCAASERVRRAYAVLAEGGDDLAADLDLSLALTELIELVGSEAGAQRVPRELAALEHGPLALLTTAALQALALGRLGAL